MAIARDLKGEDCDVVAIIGDGALTAGMAFEGLNNIGHDKRRVIVVLNDNGMSIAPNVGAVSRMLETLRTAQPYRGAKHVVRQVLDHMPAGELAEEARRRIFNSLKALLIPNLLFEQLGFTYFGPVDGHDLLRGRERAHEGARLPRRPRASSTCTRRRATATARPRMTT